MSILYKAIPRTEPGVVGGGEIKYYAGIVREREVTLREMVKEISSRRCHGRDRELSGAGAKVSSQRPQCEHGPTGSL